MTSKEVYRLTMPWGENLYRHSGAIGGNNWPLGIEFFVKDRCARGIVGRWLPCPNASVAKRIKDQINAGN